MSFHTGSLNFFSDRRLYLPVFLVTLILGIFWFVPPSVILRIMDVGERQALREVILSVGILLIFVGLVATRTSYQKLMTFLGQPQNLAVISVGMIWTAWQGIGLVVAQNKLLGWSLVGLWVAYLGVFTLSRYYSAEFPDLLLRIVRAIAFSAVGASIYLLLSSANHAFDTPNLLLNMIRLGYGESLVIGFALILFLACSEPEKRWRILWTCGVFLAFLALLQAKHRSPLIGAAVGGLIVWLSIVWQGQNHAFKRIVPGILAITAALLVQFAPHPGNLWSEKPSGIQHRFLENEEGSVGYRIFLGKVALAQFAKSPVTGIGSGNFGAEFFPTQLQLSGAENYEKISGTLEKLGAERAHNEFLQILAENGLVGLLLVLLFFFLIYRDALLTLFSHDTEPVLMSRRMIQWALMAGLLGFLTCSITSGFSWRWVSNGALFFLVLGMLPTRVSSYRSNGHRKGVKIILTLFIALLSGSLFWQGYQLYGLYRYSQGYSLAYDQRDQEAMPLLAESLMYHPDNWRARYALAEVQIRNQLFHEAYQSLRACYPVRVNGVNHLILLARTGEISGDTSPVIEGYYQQALQSYPLSPWAYLFYADFLGRQGDIIRAKPLVQRAKSLDPDLYSAAHYYFKGTPELGRKTFFHARNFHSCSRFERLYFLQNIDMK